MVPLPKLPNSIQKKLDALQPEYVVDYHGMERSGHNAIGSWIAALMPQLSGTATGAQTSNPKYHGHPAGWFGCGKKPYTGAVLIYKPDTHLPEAVSRINKQRVVVSVRDFRNLVATRLRWHKKNGRILFEVGSIMRLVWKEYAKQVLGDVDHFGGNAVSIYYDRWATDAMYRQAVAGQLADDFNWPTLNLDAAEAVKGKVTGAGGGSSFTGLDVTPEKMTVTERWLEYKDDEFFNELLTADSEILELNERLIGG